MTFKELCQRVRQECGITGTGPDTVVSQTGDYKRIVDWVASAYKDIQQKWIDWKFLWAEGTAIAMVAGTRDYDVVSGCNAVSTDTVYLDGLRLDFVPYETYRTAKDTWDDQDGTPTEFTLLPTGEIRVFPTPEAADAGLQLTYEYHKLPVEMTVDADEPLFDEAFHDVILHRAKWYWAIWDEAQLEAAGANALYAEAVRRLEARYLVNAEAHGRSQQSRDIVVRAE